MRQCTARSSFLTQAQKQQNLTAWTQIERQKQCACGQPRTFSEEEMQPTAVPASESEEEESSCTAQALQIKATQSTCKIGSETFACSNHSVAANFDQQRCFFARKYHPVHADAKVAHSKKRLPVASSNSLVWS